MDIPWATAYVKAHSFALLSTGGRWQRYEQMYLASKTGTYVVRVRVSVDRSKGSATVSIITAGDPAVDAVVRCGLTHLLRTFPRAWWHLFWYPRLPRWTEIHAAEKHGEPFVREMAAIVEEIRRYEEGPPI